MLRIILALCLAAITGASRAEQPMPPMPVGLTFNQFSPCTDDATKAKGDCVVMDDPDGSSWLVFIQDKQVMFIRHIFTDGKPFEDVWVADKFNSY